MELKEFIKETISQITDGVKDLQSELKNSGVIINPKFTVKNENRQFLATQVDAMGRSEVTNISFDVAVEVNEGKTGKSGIGIAKIIKAGVSNEDVKQSSLVNRITFSISVVFPPGNPEQITPRRTGVKR